MSRKKDVQTEGFPNGRRFSVKYVRADVLSEWNPLLVRRKFNGKMISTMYISISDEYNGNPLKIDPVKSRWQQLTKPAISYL
jgi:hypothetical protein